jgi:tRNA(Ile)-lysidine synthetase-like protein
MIEQKNDFLENDKNRKEDLLELLKQSFERLPKAPPCVWVGCSGGMDSMVLASALAALRDGGLPFVLQVAHVNYRLRGSESDGDEDLVREFTASHLVPLKVLRVDPSEHPKDLRGIQDWARQRRFDWFKTLLGPKDLLALAHHQDDLTETILMRMCRGSVLNDWMGMRELRANIWRPFLDVPQDKLATYATERNIPFRVDSSNTKLIYARNRIRLQILPELEEAYPGVRKNLRTHALDARHFTEFGLRMASRLSPQELLKEAPAAVVMQVIEARLRQYGYQGPVTRGQLEQIYRGLHSGSKMTVSLTPRLSVSVQEGDWRLERLDFPLSARWKQYRNHLLGRNGLAKFAGESRYQAAGSLEQSGGIVDNESRECDLDLPVSETDEW